MSGHTRRNELLAIADTLDGVITGFTQCIIQLACLDPKSADLKWCIKRAGQIADKQEAVIRELEELEGEG